VSSINPLNLNGRIVGLVFISGFVFGTPVFGQETESATTQFWLDVNPMRQLSDKTEIFGELGIRRDGSNQDFFRLVLRVNIRRQLGSSTRVMGGLGSFFTWNTEANNLWEIRPWVGLRFTPVRDFLPLDHYARLELRTERDTQT